MIVEFIDLQRQYRALKDKINANIQSVLDGGDYILGNAVTQLENRLAKYVGRKYCITCANGTDALSLALRALGLGEKHAVFVPTFTFFATAETVSLNGSHCVFVDVDYDTFNLSPTCLEEAIQTVLKEGKFEPKAILSVDLFGQCADYIEIEKIARKHNLYIIEDGAQGFGGQIGDRKACSFGDISTTSFFPAKPLGCYGDGGALFTDDEHYCELLKSLRFHGKGQNKYDNIRLGYNSRLDTLQAAVLLVKLQAFKDYELRNRHFIAKAYDDGLRNFVKTPVILKGFTSSYAQYTLTLDNEEQRDKLKKSLNNAGVPGMIYYPKCMHEQTVYKYLNYSGGHFINGERLTSRVLALPMHPYLTAEEQSEIIEGVKNALC